MPVALIKPQKHEVPRTVYLHALERLCCVVLIVRAERGGRGLRLLLLLLVVVLVRGVREVVLGANVVACEMQWSAWHGSCGSTSCRERDHLACGLQFRDGESRVWREGGESYATHRTRRRGLRRP